MRNGLAYSPRAILPDIQRQSRKLNENLARYVPVFLLLQRRPNAVIFNLGGDASC
jgi:hypothetical protein